MFKQMSDGDVEPALIKIFVSCLDIFFVMEYVQDPNASDDQLGIMQMLYEWDADSVASQIDDPELYQISADGSEDWFRQILAGQWVGGIVNELLLKR